VKMAVMRKEFEVTFTVGGKTKSLTKKAVEAAVKNLKPEAIKKYSVRIGDRDFPIKQVLSAATGIPGAAFISTDAYRTLTRLGFDVAVEQN
jgi:hypothetical protein